MQEDSPLSQSRSCTAITGLVLVGALALAGCVQDGGDSPYGGDGGDGATGGDFDVAATSDISFDPKTITVQVNETVTWKNTAGFAHDVKSYSVPENGSSFSSQDLEGGEKFAVTFDEPGTYKYYCSIHSQPEDGGEMVGKVVVEAA